MEAISFSHYPLDTQQPLQHQLQRYLTEDICNQRLLPGTKLPSSRLMAKELGISRNTVTAVIDQLKAEGFLISQPGKGVFVVEDLPENIRPINQCQWQNRRSIPRLSLFGQRLMERDLRQHDVTLPFTPGVPDLKAFPLKVWNILLKHHSGRQALMAYDGNQGYEPLRIALANYLRISRGVRCLADQIVITHGAQQAISLCTQLLLNPQDKVIVENPGYMGARKAFAAIDATLQPCELNEFGLDIAKLPQHANNSHGCKLLYCTPTHHYPLGGIVPGPTRMALLDWASENNCWIIEDDYDSEFHFYHKPIAAMQGMADNTPVIYMGSFSKTLFPALRLGYLVIPEALVDVFVKAKSYMSGESPLLHQAVVADFIEEGHFVRHLRRMRKIYKEKWEHLQALLSSELKGKVFPIAKSAGMHLTIEIPSINDVEVALSLKSHGFGSSPLSSYYVGKPLKTGLVLGFANTDVDNREKLVELLKNQI